MHASSDESKPLDPEEPGYRSLEKHITTNVDHLKHDFVTQPYTERWTLDWASWAFWILLVLVGICVPACLLFVELRDEKASSAPSDLRFFQAEPRKQHLAMAYLSLVPFTLLAIPVFLPSVWRVSAVPYVLIILASLRHSAEVVVSQKYIEYIDDLIGNLTCALLSFSWLRLWDYLDHIMREVVQGESHLLDEPPIAKQRDILHSRGVTSTGRPERDRICSYGAKRKDRKFTPAFLLYTKVWHALFVFSRLYGLGLFLVYVLMSKDVSIGAGAGLIFYSGLSAVAAFRLGTQAVVLVKIFLSKPFYIGDIVTIGHLAQTGISGFVEHVSLSYVIIRDFEYKQVFIPLAELETLTICNWTRRPTKPILLDFSISGRCEVSAVDALIKFARQWIDQDPRVLQTCFKKCAINRLENGFDCRIVFSPEIGQSKTSLRQDFIVSFMAAAERLQVPLVAGKGVSMQFPEGRDHPFHGAHAAQPPPGPQEAAVPAAGDGLPDLLDLLPSGHAESQEGGAS